jgi:hypothetical protein
MPADSQSATPVVNNPVLSWASRLFEDVFHGNNNNWRSSSAVATAERSADVFSQHAQYPFS